MSDDKKDEVSWNLGGKIIDEIGEQIKHFSYYNSKRDYAKSFDCLRTIRMIVVAYLESEELKELEEIEDSFYLYTRDCKVTGFGKPTNEQEKKLFLQFKTHNKYNTMLHGFMKKIGILIPIKEDRTRLNA